MNHIVKFFLFFGGVKIKKKRILCCLEILKRLFHFKPSFTEKQERREEILTRTVNKDFFQELMSERCLILSSVSSMSIKTGGRGGFEAKNVSNLISVIVNDKFRIRNL